MEQERKVNSVSLGDELQVLAGPEGEEDLVQILLRKVVFRQAFIDDVSFFGEHVPNPLCPC